MVRTMSVLNNSSEEQVDCPLCMESLEVDDLSFFPCSCGYQICRFCWHRIRTQENGLCPACRKSYPENPTNFRPLTLEELQKIKNEKKRMEVAKKQRVVDSRKPLSNVRVVQRNLIFVVGLPSRLADAEMLKRQDYFGKFGKILKIVVNNTPTTTGSQQGQSASAYVTYYKSEDALKAIHSVSNISIDGRTLKASLGTTKYCSNFLKNQPCPKLDCMYLHELGDSDASFTKEEMQQRKHQEYERRLTEQLFCLHRKNNIRHSKEKREDFNCTSSEMSRGKSRSRKKGKSKGCEGASGSEISGKLKHNKIPPRLQRQPFSECQTDRQETKSPSSLSTSSTSSSSAQFISTSSTAPLQDGNDNLAQLFIPEPSESDGEVPLGKTDFDDDLGFDPFAETVKALADLMNAESEAERIKQEQENSYGYNVGMSHERAQYGINSWPITAPPGFATHPPTPAHTYSIGNDTTNDWSEALRMVLPSSHSHLLAQQEQRTDWQCLDPAIVASGGLSSSPLPDWTNQGAPNPFPYFGAGNAMHTAPPPPGFHHKPHFPNLTEGL